MLITKTQQQIVMVKCDVLISGLLAFSVALLIKLYLGLSEAVVEAL